MHVEYALEVVEQFLGELLGGDGPVDGHDAGAVGEGAHDAVLLREAHADDPRRVRLRLGVHGQLSCSPGPDTLARRAFLMTSRSHSASDSATCALPLGATTRYGGWPSSRVLLTHTDHGRRFGSRCPSGQCGQAALVGGGPAGSSMAR